MLTPAVRSQDAAAVEHALGPLACTTLVQMATEENQCVTVAHEQVKGGTIFETALACECGCSSVHDSSPQYASRWHGSVPTRLPVLLCSSTLQLFGALIKWFRVASSVSSAGMLLYPRDFLNPF